MPYMGLLLCCFVCLLFSQPKPEQSQPSPGWAGVLHRYLQTILSLTLTFCTTCGANNPFWLVSDIPCDEWWVHTLHHTVFQSTWVEMCLHMEFWYMCQSQAGNSNGAECFCNQINHLSTEERHFLAIRQLPNHFITSLCYKAIRKSLRIDQKLIFEGKIPGASIQVLWEVLGWVGLWLFCWVFLNGSFPNYLAFHVLPWKPHSQYNPWAFPQSLSISSLAQSRNHSGIAPIRSPFFPLLAAFALHSNSTTPLLTLEWFVCMVRIHISTVTANITQ